MTTTPERDKFNFFVPHKKPEIAEHPIAKAQEEALNFIQRLATEDGAIVSSSVCSALEIAKAKQEDRFFVDHDGLGYVLRFQKWRQTAESCIHALHGYR